MVLALAFLAPFLIALFLILLLRQSLPPETIHSSPLPQDSFERKATLEEIQNFLTRWVESLSLTLLHSSISPSGLIEIVGRKEDVLLGGVYLFWADFSGQPITSMKLQALHEAVRGEGMLKGIFLTMSTFTDQARQYASKKALTLLDYHDLKQLLPEPWLAYFSNSSITSAPTKNKKEAT